MTTLRRPPNRVVRLNRLGDADRDDLEALVDSDPLVNCVIASRLATIPSLMVARFGGAVLGIRDGDLLRAAVFSGGNLLPIGGADRDWEQLANHLAGLRRVCTSIVGRADAVAAMWRVLAPAWGSPRAVRASQTLLAISRPGPSVAADPRVRPIRACEIEQYLPAATAMFTEELGVSPLMTVSPAAYRRRVAGLIDTGRAFGIVDRDGSVIFKADIGAISRHSCQVQGVWVRSDLRGRGLGTAALGCVVGHALTLAPTVSLYVNDYNVTARRMYERLGMHPVATLSTVLF